MNHLHLKALAKLLREIADPKHFNMSFFAANEDLDELDPVDVDREILHECGTVACAVGHATLLFPGEGDETWANYSARVFGITHIDDAWLFMFGGEWVGVDNTPEGAAKRIEYILNPANAVPSLHDIQQMQRAVRPLCYV